MHHEHALHQILVPILTINIASHMKPLNYNPLVHWQHEDHGHMASYQNWSLLYSISIMKNKNKDSYNTTPHLIFHIIDEYMIISDSVFLLFATKKESM